MSHQLYDITLYYYGDEEITKRFTMKQNVVSDLYVKYLEGYKPPKTTRISVRLGNADDPGRHFGSILGPTAQFDSEKFWGLGNAEQNRMILDTIHRVALLCANHFGWNEAPFEKAYTKVLSTDFKYCLDADRKISRDRRHSATIRIKKNEEYTTILAVFFDSDQNMIKEVELLKSHQMEMFYGGLTRKYKWFGNREFGMYLDGEQIVIKASLDHNDPEIIVTPKWTEREILEGYLRRATYVEFNSHDDIVKWMNQ